jgi:phage terminase Nu1 subunit (DNA packaging protein)
MPTLSFHAPAPVARAIRAAAKQRGQKVSRFLLASAEAAVTTEPVSGLARELEKLAIDSMAQTALQRSQARAKELELDRMTPARIRAEIMAARRERPARP